MIDMDLEQAPISIVRIDVEKLFGKYTYSLPDEDIRQENYSSLLIMYGDNGCGKTTVLKLLFHVLSPALRRGHRSFIARVPFKSFSVLLADGTRITVRRKDDNLIGPYQFLF